VLGPLSIEVSSNGLDDAGKPAGPGEVDGYGNSLECVFPGRFRVRLAATGRGTLIHATSAIDLAPRKTETPRPGSPNLVEGLARDARIRLGRPLSYSAGTGGLS
jgi:hypothetical protein